MKDPQGEKTSCRTRPGKTKLKTLTDALNAEKKRSEECLIQLQYLQADFENFKKRTEREMGQIRQFCCEPFVANLLEVADELEAATNSARASDSKEALLEGVEMTLKKLTKAFESEGVTPINCVNTVFDPSKHHAVERVEQEEVNEGAIIKELRKGYIMKGKVIRPSIVKIAVEPPRKGVEEKNE